MSYVNGFKTGFGMVNTLQQQQAEKERLAMLDERDESRYTDEQKRLAMLDDKEAKRYEEGRLFDMQKHAQEQANSNRTFEEQKKNNSFNRNMQSNEWSLKQDAKNNKDALAAIQLFASGGVVDEKGKNAIQRSVYAGTYNKMAGKIDSYNQHLATYRDDFTPEEAISWANDPTSLSLATDAFNNEIRVREKETGNRYEIGGVDVLGGKVVPLFNIYSPEGKMISERVPATKNRTGDKSDLINGVPIQDFKAKTVSAVSFVNQVNENPELKRLILGDDRKVDATLDKLESETNKNNATAEYYRGGKGSNAALSQKDIDQGYMKYLNANADSVTGEQPMSKSDWMAANGLGPKRRTLLELLQEQNQEN